MSFAFDGHRAAALGRDGRAWRRDLAQEEEWQPCWPERQAGRPVVYTALALSPDGTRAALGLSGCRVEVLGWPGGGGAVELPAILPEPAQAYSLAFSPDGKMLAAGCARSGFINDPAYVSVGRSGGVALYDLPSQRLLGQVLTPKDDVMAVAFSPDGSHLFWGGTDCTVRAYDLAARKEVAVLSGHVGGVSALAFSPDGQALASAGGDGLVRLWPWREMLAGAPAPPVATKYRPAKKPSARGKRGK